MKLTPKEEEFIAEMCIDTNHEWSNFDPPFLRGAYSRLLKKGWFVSRGEGSEIEFSWTDEGRKVLRSEVVK